MKVDYPPGTNLVVRYLDHSAATCMEQATPDVNEAVGYYVKTDTKNNTEYVILAHDTAVGGDLLHPFSVILSNDIVSIKRWVTEGVNA